jgi:hypothetical protein
LQFDDSKSCFSYLLDHKMLEWFILFSNANIPQVFLCGERMNNSWMFLTENSEVIFIIRFSKPSNILISHFHAWSKSLLIQLPFIKAITFPASCRSIAPNWERSRSEELWSSTSGRVKLNDIDLLLLEVDISWWGSWTSRRQWDIVRHVNCTITNVISVHFWHSYSIDYEGLWVPGGRFRLSVTCWIGLSSPFLSQNVNMNCLTATLILNQVIFTLISYNFMELFAINVQIKDSFWQASKAKHKHSTASWNW